MMDLKAILAAKKAAKEQAEQAVIAAQAPATINDEEWKEATHIADAVEDSDVEAEEPEVHSLADLVVADEPEYTDYQELEAMVQAPEIVAAPTDPLPAHVEAHFPAEAFIPAAPMSFKEKLALKKAAMEAEGKTLPVVALRDTPVVSKATQDAQDRLHAEHSEQARLRKEKEAQDAEAIRVGAEQAANSAAISAKLIADRAAAQAEHAEWQKREDARKEKDRLASIANARANLVPTMQAKTKEEIGKLTFAERVAMKKHAQEEAAKAVEEMDLASEPPEELSTKLVGEVDKLAQTTASIDDLDAAFDSATPPVEDSGTFNLNITLNAKQLMAKELALAGKCYALIGAAGTGKTTTQRSVAETLVEDDRLKTCTFKVVGGTPGQRVSAPSIAFVAYTRRASANLARAIHKSPALEAKLQHNIMTIHALLEFEPETFWNDEKQKEDFRFIPRRNAMNPLTITHLVIEEASMLGLDLWDQLFDALPHGVQIIFIGDINQLPPVFGASILNYALVQLPIVELTEVYRNAGIVLASAHNVLAGKPLIEGESHDEETGVLTGKVSIVRGKSPTQVGQGKMAMSLGKMFKAWYDMGYYNPDDCMILSPWNKKDLGTDNMNSWIAQFLGDNRKAVVWEVISGFNKLYLAVGDKVMYNKQDAVITDIKYNGMYHGKDPQAPGADLGRFGVRILGAEHMQELEIEDQLLTYSNFSVDELEETAMERKQQASHIVTIETETGQKLSLSAAGDFGPQVFSLGYVLTVHKAQGCEWKKVFIILHKDHAVSLTRELFYTALTRARLECIVIAKDTVIEKAISTQRIKGNSLADKIEYFNSGAMDIGAVTCVK